MFSSSTYIPYCGVAPVPHELWQRWNLDPILIAVLLAGIAWHSFVILRHGNSRQRIRIALAGWTAVLIGVISPLCALGVALFSARVAQHMWLTLVAAPLLILARGIPELRTSPLASAAVFAACLWAWHLPALYDLTLRSDLAYWAMHVSLFATAALLWQRICLAGEAHWLQRVGAGFLTLVQMGLLGASITLASRLLYLPHVHSAPAWGLTPLQDQLLGGLIMWVPSCAVLLIAALAVLHGVITRRSGLREAPSA